MQTDHASPTTYSKRPAATQGEGDSPKKRHKRDGDRAHRTSIRPVPDVEGRDKDFWYMDGTVVIRVRSTLFRLHRSRLEKYCAFFQHLFAADADAPLNEMIDGCPVYHVPPELSANGFKDLLNALETPMAFVNSPPSQVLAVSLLYASHTLACDVVLRLAKTSLCDIWDATRVPNDDGSDARTYHDAIYIVQLARQFDIKGVLKRAFYEIASSKDFWDALAADRKSIRLGEADLLSLYELRLALGVMWREFVFVAPNTDKHGSIKKSCGSRSLQCVFSDRVDSWRDEVVERRDFEKGAMDPLKFDLASEREKAGDYNMRGVASGSFCLKCLKMKGSDWRAKRREWWIALDNVLKL